MCVGLVILIHVVERQTDELTINNGLRVIEGIAVGIYGSHETGSAGLELRSSVLTLCRVQACLALPSLNRSLDTVIQLTDTTNEGVTIALTVATAEEGDGLA